MISTEDLPDTDRVCRLGMQVTAYMHFFPVIIAEHLNVRHIIVWAWWALMWPYTEVVLVCMYVCL